MKDCTFQTRKGFTLIELLVVIAIIALLAAILFPVFAKAREKARQTACLSNMKQMALGITQYCGDYDETLPHGWQNPGLEVGWAGSVYPYVKSTAVFQCPDDPTKMLAGNPPFYPVSYALNSNLLSYGPTKPSWTLPQMVSPAVTVMCFEVQGDVAQITRPEEAFPAPNGAFSPCGNGLSFWIAPGQNKRGLSGNNSNNATLTYATGYFATRIYSPGMTSPTDLDNPVHSDGSNYIMSDGHAKWAKASAISAGFGPTASTNAQGQGCPGPTTGTPCAAGTSNLTDSASTTQFAFTFSPT